MTTFTSPTLRTAAGIIAGAETGAYELPAKVTTARAALDVLSTEVTRVSAIATGATDQHLATRILGAAENGTKFPTADDVLTAIQLAQATERYQRLLADARNQLEARLENALVSTVDELLTEKLATALAEVVETVRRVADILPAVPVDDGVIVRTDDDDIRAAWLDLVGPVATRYSAIRKAQEITYRIGRAAKLDDGRFTAMANVLDYRPNPRLRAPWPDDTPNFLLWAVRSGAKLWTPTAAQRDDAWRTAYADEMAKNKTSTAVAAGGLLAG